MVRAVMRLSSGPSREVSYPRGFPSPLSCSSASLRGTLQTCWQPCSDLLAQAVTATASQRLDLEPAFLRLVAAVLVGALPGDPARAPEAPLWSMVQAMESGIVVDVVTALDTIDSGLAGVAVNIFLA